MPTNTIAGFAAGDSIDLAGVGYLSTDYVAYSGTSSGGTVTIDNQSGAAIASFALSGYYNASDFSLGPDANNDILLYDAVAPTITGTTTTDTTSEKPVTPFSGVTIGDANVDATDKLSITFRGGGTLADGAGFNGLSGSNGSYTLTGTAAAITSELAALVFTPVDGVPNTSVTTTFTLSDTRALSE